MCSGEGSYKCIDSNTVGSSCRAVQSSAEQAAVAAAAEGSLLLLHVRGGTLLQCLQPALRSSVLGRGRGDSVLRQRLGVVGVCCSLHCLVAARGGFGELDLEHSE